MTTYLHTFLLPVVLVFLMAVSACGGGGSDDDASEVGDDDATAGDDDSSVAGDDDATEVGDDDMTVGDDDVTAGDDDATEVGDDDMTVGDDDVTEVGDDDVTPMDVVFKVVDTAQDKCYNDQGTSINCPPEGQRFHGQDAQYLTVEPSYTFNDDQTVVLDLNTGLMWERAHHATRVSLSEAESACTDLELGGYSDWRLPDIKELFSIADFRGAKGGAFFLDSDYFDLEIPDEDTVELSGTHSFEMMGQTWSSTRWADGSADAYFFNFLDGHIKSGRTSGNESTLFYRCVRGKTGMFSNTLTNNGDGTVTDSATGLMWQQSNGESGGDYRFNWEEALDYCESLSLAGHEDWRLPDVKELQSIVDYSRVDPALDTSVFAFEDYNPDAPVTGPFFWSSTTHGNYTDWAAYVCHGHCWTYDLQRDIHGPGAQRADPKYDDGTEYPQGTGDQEDLVQIDNYVRCVRGGV